MWGSLFLVEVGMCRLSMAVEKILGAGQRFNFY
jgi:hypothetical protein